MVVCVGRSMPKSRRRCRNHRGPGTVLSATACPHKLCYGRTSLPDCRVAPKYILLGTSGMTVGSNSTVVLLFCRLVQALPLPLQKTTDWSVISRRRRVKESQMWAVDEVQRGEFGPSDTSADCIFLFVLSLRLGDVASNSLHPPGGSLSCSSTTTAIPAGPASDIHTMIVNRSFR